MFLKIFALVLAAGMLATGIWTYTAGESVKKTLEHVYVNKQWPWWMILTTAIYVILYIAALVSFITSPDKTWAGWVLILIFPVGAILKMLFRKKAKTIQEVEGWRKLALVRSIIFTPLLIILAFYV